MAMKIHFHQDAEHPIYDSFTKELQQWSESGHIPALADRETAYYLELQGGRLARKRLHHELELRKYTDEVLGVQHCPGNHYEDEWVYASVRRSVRYHRDGRCLYQKKSDQILYQTITHADTPDGIGEKPYSCPNCGATARVAELVRGCPYCNARFQISELFPKVTNFYFLRMDSIRSRKKQIRCIMACCMLLCFLSMCLRELTGAAEHTGLLTKLISSVLVGGFLGYFLSGPLLLLSMLVANSARHVPLRAVFTKKKITNFMKSLDPDFSYRYFEGQMLSFLRMVIFSEDADRLSAFQGEERSAEFNDIIDMVYTGGMTVRSMQLTPELCRLELVAYTNDSYEVDGRIFVRNDRIAFTAERSRHIRPNPGFSITLVRCRSCGASFDASHQKCCPYCGTSYEMRADSWVITKAVLLR